MSKQSGRGPKHLKAINLALQGGGAHGAFTWGVLDRLFEEDHLWIEAISGTSAGAMNAVVATQGMYDNGADGARQALEDFWRKVSDTARTSPLQRTPLDMLLGNWSLEHTPGYMMLDLMTRLASPYDLNPFDINPLRDLVEEFVDFDKVARETDMEVFLSATNVETGRVRVFRRHEISTDVIMASACLPFMYKAVEIDGVPYWDGGYMGNPVLFPFIDYSPSSDIVIVQINPIERPGTPRTAHDILNRVNEITFNASLLRDLRAIDFVDRLLEEGKLSADSYRKMKIHVIDGCGDMLKLDASSKLNAEWAFLIHLRDIGRNTAQEWLKKHFDDIETRSTVDIRAMFAGIGSQHHG